MNARRLITLIFGMMLLLLAAAPAGAESPRSYVNLNSWYCPADYDQVSDCTKIGDVFVRVTADGQVVDEVATRSSEGVEVDVPVGAFVAIEIIGGVPEYSALEDVLLSFTAAEGANPVTLIFVDQGQPGPIETPHADVSAIVVRVLRCPVEYAGNDFAGDCDPEKGIAVDLSRDATEFGVSGETGSDGVVGFPGLGEGNYTIALGIPGDFADFQTFCGTPRDVEPRQRTNPHTNRIGVYLGPSEELTCTFSVIPVAARGEPVRTPVPVTNLPTTGSGDVIAAERSVSPWMIGLALAAGLLGSGLVALSRRRTA